MHYQYKKVLLIGRSTRAIVHAMEFKKISPGSSIGFVLNSRTFCGAASGNRDFGWDINEDATINCWKCLKILRQNENSISA